jgi:hypothetical protein
MFSIESLVALVVVLVGGAFLLRLARDASNNRREARSLIAVMAGLAALAPIVAGRTPLMTLAGYIIFTVFFFLLSLALWASNRDRLFIGSALGFLAAVVLARWGGA